MWYIASEENINYLAHHGVKGQKWGVRKRRQQYAVNPNGPKAQRYAQQQRRKRIARNVAIGVGATAAAAGAAYLTSRFVKNRKALNYQKFKTGQALQNWNDAQNKLNSALKSGDNNAIKKYELVKRIADNDLSIARSNAQYLQKHKLSYNLDPTKKEGIKAAVGKLKEKGRDVANDLKELDYQRRVNEVFKGKRK